MASVRIYKRQNRLELLACVLCLASRAEAASPLIDRLEAGQQQTIVLYGTSLTAGGAWVPQLSTSLNTLYPGQITWVNSGQSGRASNTGVANLASAVLAHQPDAVFIEFAMNDAFTAYPVGDVDFDVTPAKSKANLNAMIDAVLNQNPAAQIILQTMNPSWDAPNGNQSATKRPQLARYYQGYRDVAAERGVTLVDNNAIWLKVQSNSSAEFHSLVADGTHPNAVGYNRFVTPAVRFALGAENGLALLVDPASGRGVLHNQTGEPIELISYTVSSSSGALLTAWNSLSDRGNNAWLEANPTPQHLSELSPLNSLEFHANAATSLGYIWDPSKALDLTFSYQTIDGVNHESSVIYTPAAETMALSGDFNDDGDVDGSDFLHWQRSLGSASPAFTSADDSGDGIVDAVDLASWRQNFGANVGAVEAISTLTTLVPEPGISSLAAAASVMMLRRNRPTRTAPPTSDRPAHQDRH